jgi:hypothetical protein
MSETIALEVVVSDAVIDARWNEPGHGSDGKEQAAKNADDQGPGPVHRTDIREDRKLLLRRLCERLLSLSTLKIKCAAWRS